MILQTTLPVGGVFSNVESFKNMYDSLMARLNVTLKDETLSIEDRYNLLLSLDNYFYYEPLICYDFIYSNILESIAYTLGYDRNTVVQINEIIRSLTCWEEEFDMDDLSILEEMCKESFEENLQEFIKALKIHAIETKTLSFLSD